MSLPRPFHFFLAHFFGLPSSALFGISSRPTVKELTVKPRLYPATLLVPAHINVLNHGSSAETSSASAAGLHEGDGEYAVERFPFVRVVVFRGGFVAIIETH